MRRRPPCRDFGADERSQELAAMIEELGRTVSATQRALLAGVAEFDQAGSWRGDGAVSMVAWLTERCGVSGGTARIWVRAAARLESLPHLADALGDGSLSLDAVAPLAEVATPETDARLAADSLDWTVKQVKELAASLRGASDAAAARRFEQRSWRFNDAKQTMWGAFTADDYAVAKAALISRVSWVSPNGVSVSTSEGGTESSAGDVPHGVDGSDPLGYVTFDQRLYDAFMEMCRRGEQGGGVGTGGSAGAGSGGVGRGGISKGGKYRPTFVVHADLGFLTGLDPGGTAELAGVGPISREVARRLICDAEVVFSLEKDGCILDQKRVRRSPTAAQRIEIARRDKGCRFASCGFVDFTEVHHMVPWDLGGETNLSNLITLCGRHHRAVHELGWSMKGSANGVVTFEGPHGHRMTSAPSPTWRRAGTAPMRR
jgi:hypothetical protein